ncbi:MAG: type II toxin-antitoxin system RelE/ParE family toxin [Candidatus Sulfotelmatobacter sp.]
MSQEPLLLHPEAEQEYRDAYSWYRERSGPAAEKFENAVERALHQIEQSPDRWPLSHSHFRKYTLYEFPYSIYYRWDAARTFVLALAHGRRRPGYWKGRV